MTGVIGELRAGLRTFRRRPLYAVGASGTWALGLTAALVTFAVAWKVWLEPLPVPDPERVVRLYEVEPPEPTDPASTELARAGDGGGRDARRQQLSPPLLEDLRGRDWRTLEPVSALVLTGGASDGDRSRETVDFARAAVSPEGFRILGIEPILGALPGEIEGEVLLSERLWRSAFGGDPDVVGTVLSEGDVPVEIVGVAPFPAGIPGNPQALTTVEWTGADVREGNRGVRFVDAFARVRPEYSVAEARAEVNAFLTARSEDYPLHRGWSVEVVPLGQSLVRPYRDVLSVLLAAGALFLLLAGVNVTGLVAARRIEGRHDRSIRLALGASERRLLRGALVESLLLAMVGAGTGVVGAYWLMEPIRSLVPRDVPRVGELAVTPALALGGIFVAVAAGLLVGSVGYLVSRGREPSACRRSGWAVFGAGGRRALVVGQVALTTLFVAGGTGVLHHASRLSSTDLGFDPEGVSATTATLSDARYPSAEAKRQVWRSILDGLEARGIPAALVVNPPMAGGPVPPMGMRGEAGPDGFFYQYHLATGDYFSLMGIQLLAGRVFGPEEERSGRGGVVVSRAFVERYFPPGTSAQEAVGREIGPVLFAGSGGGSDGDDGPVILGVVESTRHTGPDAPVSPDVYVPFTRWMDPPGTLLVRGEPAEVGAAVSTVLDRADPELSWTPLMPYTSHLREWFAPLRLQIAVIGVLGALGLLLACLGLYSLMAYRVAIRRPEIGVRKAVGAPDGALVSGVVVRGMTTAALGAVVGLVAWYPLLPFTRGLVDGIDSAGALVPLSVLLVVGGSGVVATLLPALRAARVDPVVTLDAN